MANHFICIVIKGLNKFAKENDTADAESKHPGSYREIIHGLCRARNLGPLGVARRMEGQSASLEGHQAVPPVIGHLPPKLHQKTKRTADWMFSWFGQNQACKIRRWMGSCRNKKGMKLCKQTSVKLVVLVLICTWGGVDIFYQAVVKAECGLTLEAG